LIFENKTRYYNEKVFFINLPIANLMHDTAYLTIANKKRIHNYWSASEGSIFYFFIADIPLCLIIYKVNKLFIAAVKHNNIL